MPYGTNLTSLIATFTTSGEKVTVAEVTQVSTQTSNDFSNPVVYKVHAEDGSTKDYTVTVSVAPFVGKYAYFANYIGNSYTQCKVNSTDGALSECNTVTPTGSGALNRPFGVTISNGYAYFANYNGASYTQCKVNSTDGALSECNTVTPTGSGALNRPGGVTISNGYAYFANYNGNSYTQCKVNSTDYNVP